MGTRLTGGENFDLLNGSLVKKGAGLEQLDGRVTSVGKGSLDTGVANSLKLDVKWGRVALGHVNVDGAGQRGQQRNTDGELHDGCKNRESKSRGCR